jgi:hypothetical protein
MSTPLNSYLETRVPLLSLDPASRTVDATRVIDTVNLGVTSAAAVESTKVSMMNGDLVNSPTNEEQR